MRKRNGSHLAQLQLAVSFLLLTINKKAPYGPTCFVNIHNLILHEKESVSHLQPKHIMSSSKACALNLKSVKESSS